MNRDTTSGGRTPAPASGRSRGQTAQDFAVGIGLFLLAVAFVFAFVPQVIAPFETGVGASEAAQADRAATVIVGNLSVENRPNELDSTATDDYFQSLADAEDVQNRTGLPFTARVNVTIAELEDDSIAEGTERWAAGADYREGREAASASRIVRTTGDQCDPGCQVVVRVW